MVQEPQRTRNSGGSSSAPGSSQQAPATHAEAQEQAQAQPPNGLRTQEGRRCRALGGEVRGAQSGGREKEFIRRVPVVLATKAGS